MTTPWRLLAIPVVAVALVTSCGGDDSGGADPTTTTPAPTTAAPATTAVVSTTAPATTTTEPAPTTTVPDEPVSGDSVEIIVTVGVDSSPDRVEPVPLGSDVLLRVLSDEADEIHVHGYDIELEVPAGGEAAFEFTADQAGRFEVESHTTDEVLLVLEVS